MINMLEQWQDRFYGWKKRRYYPWKARITSTLWLVPEGEFRKQLTFKLLRSLSRKNYTLFNNIQSIDVNTKESIRPIIRRRTIEVTNSIVSNWMKMLEDLNKLLILFVLMTILGAVIGPIIYWSVSITKVLSVLQWGIFIIFHAFFFVSSLWFLFLPYLVPLRIKATTWAIITNMFYVGTIFLLSKIQVSFLFLSAIISGLIGALIVTIPAFLIINAVAKTTSHNIENTSMATYDSVIVFELVTILSSTETNENTWSNTGFKNNIMLRLEKLASVSEHKLLSELITYDAATSDWLNKTAKEIAAGFRSLKKWILTPKDDSRKFFINHIKNDLLSAVNGSWDKLEKCTPETISIQRSGRDKIKSIAGDVLSGIIPLGLISLLKYFGILDNGVGSDYIIASAVGWTMLSILSIFNPTVNDIKLDTLKGILSKLTLG